VTTLSRTLLDSAAVLSRQQLVREVEEADRLGLLELRAAEEMCRRHPHRSGVVNLHAVLGDLVATDSPGSALEQLFLQLCREECLPDPVANVEVAGFQVDALWPAHRLVVELDGHEFHRTRGAFETDRIRDAALQGAGYRVIRLTWRRLTKEREEAVAQLRGMLARR
jgi:very-short-patch-repair endonuclease